MKLKRFAVILRAVEPRHAVALAGQLCRGVEPESECAVSFARFKQTDFSTGKSTAVDERIKAAPARADRLRTAKGLGRNRPYAVLQAKIDFQLFERES
ncbi:hypothetical protein BH10BDE1_BH10BDE1_17970 [soil metagenome]